MKASAEYCDELLTYHETSRSRIGPEHDDLFPLIDKPVDRSRASAWQSDLSRTAIADVESAAGDLLDDLGYPILGVGTPLWVTAMRGAAQRVRPAARQAWRRIA